MRRKSPQCAAAIALSLAARGRAAEERAVDIDVAPAATCVVVEKVAEALRRSGVRARMHDAASELDALHVTVSGTGESFVVTIRGGGRDVSETMANVPCAAATDMVAAFLISTLAPPVRDVEPPPNTTQRPVDADELRRAIGDTLARRGVQLAVIGATLDIGRDASRTWFVRVGWTGYRLCSKTIALGDFDELSSVRIDQVTDVVGEMLRNHPGCGERDNPEQVPVLRKTLYRIDSAQKLWPWVAAGEGVAGTLLIVGLVAGHHPNVTLGYSTAQDAWATTAGVLAVGGAVGSFFVGDDYQSSVIGVSALGALGSLWLVHDVHDGNVPAYQTGALAAGGFATAALIGVNAILRRPPVSRLRAAYTELGTSSVSSARVAAIERDLEKLQSPLAPWIVWSPLMLGGVVATIPAFASGFENDNRNLFAGIGAVYLCLGIAGALSPNLARNYREDLEKSGLVDVSVGPGPGDRGGVSLSGRF